MKTGFALFSLLAAGLAAQTVETIPYRAVLASSNEVPAGSVTASGAATVWLHVLRDASGKVTSGSVDANVSYKFPGAVTITAMHIHAGPAGANGGVVLPFAIARTDDAAGTGSLAPIQTQFPTTGTTLDTINGILAEPSQYYFNVHTTDAPGGAMRGQLQRAEATVRMGIMSPANETPAITGQAWSGIATITSLITRSGGKATSALVIFDVSYSGFADDTTFTGLHIHLGPAGAAGPVTINTGLRSVAGAQGGAGTFHYEVEADVTQQPVLNTLEAIANNPAAAYVNAHTSVAPGGAIRSQLLATDRTEFQVTMSPSNEVPAVAIAATTPAAIDVFTVRKADGSVAAGTVVFDVNPRLPAGSTFTGLHIHDQVAGQNGPVTIDSGLGGAPILVSDGTGNIFRIAQVKTPAGLAALNSLVMNPEKHYVNIHTSANAGGATRSQLAAAVTAPPVVTFVETAVQDPGYTTLAPGSLVLIAGSNLAKVGANLDGFNDAGAYPMSINGVKATIGGKQAPIFLMTTDRVFAQVPFDVAPGQQPVVVTNSNGSSAAVNATVAAVAPAIFIYSEGAAVLKTSDYSVVGPGNGARAEETVMILATGLGQTSPALQTGEVADDTDYVLGKDVTVKFGAVSVPAMQTIVAPGFAGVYEVMVKVPAGLAAGQVPLTVSVGQAGSNATMVTVQ